MENSILNTTKKALGIDPDYDAFDVDITMHVNSALSTLTQLGVGPPGGFMVDSADTMWNEFIGDDTRLNSVKTYVYLKVRLLFDPPAAANLVTAINDQIRELEWRINVTSEEEKWRDPSVTTTT